MKLRHWLQLTPTFLSSLGRLPLRHLFYMASVMRYENPRRHNGQLHINTFFPPIPSKAFSRFMRSAAELQRVPFSTYFAVTDQCPFSCAHCSYGHHQPGALPTQKAIDVIGQIKSLGTCTIGFTGGEPLLRDDIVELVNAVGDDTESIIFTTGHKLTAERACQFARAKLGCIMIGIESSDKNKHDAVRGAVGSHDEGVQAIRYALEAGLYTAISTVATRDKINSGELERMAQLASEYGVHEFRVLEPVPTGSFSDNIDERLTAEESKQAANFHKEWNRQGAGPAVASFAWLESDEMFGCGAGYHHLYIDAVGNVCPCDLTPLALGNVFDTPLTEIWQQMADSFDLPRCGCFMKEICQQVNSQGGTSLPLSPDQSIGLCQKNKRKEELPKIYSNLFRRQRDK